MKLIKLTCDQPSFKPIRFNPEGLTLIIGDKEKSDSEDGSSNGVGKTLSLGLIHHCLGATKDKKLAAAVPEWIFRLDLTLGGEPHVIQRSGDGKRIWLDDEAINLSGLRAWLNNRGPFDLTAGIERLSFRALVSRFGRLRPKDCEEPVKTSSETPYDALLRSCFLLGVDTSLVTSKHKSKLELDSIRQSEANWRDDTALRDMFRAGTNPKVQAEFLEAQIERLNTDLLAFKVADDYRQIELTAGEKTSRLREIETSQEVIKFQFEQVEKALQKQPDIGKDDLLELYSGLQQVFKAEVLKHFDAVEAFHASLTTNRGLRLEKERLQLQEQREILEAEWQSVSAERDSLLQSLNGKRALDEYAALARKHAAMQEELERLKEYLTYSDKLQGRIQTIREKRVKEDGKAAVYARTDPLEHHAARFQQLVGMLYENMPAGMVLEPNNGDNQVRYDLSVSIEGDSSDGINAARIVVFDWILAMQGANHTMGFLWHDNRLFAHIDPLQRARWFKFVHAALADTGKQYIASLNTENLDTMNPHLDYETQQALIERVAVTLRGDTERNKLLGIQFGGEGK